MQFLKNTDTDCVVAYKLIHHMCDVFIQCLSVGDFSKIGLLDSASVRSVVNLQLQLLQAEPPLQSDAVLSAMQASNVAHNISHQLLPDFSIAPIRLFRI